MEREKLEDLIVSWITPHACNIIAKKAGKKYCGEYKELIDKIRLHAFDEAQYEDDYTENCEG